jgi:hypothetical protein
VRGEGVLGGVVLNSQQENPCCSTCVFLLCQRERERDREREREIERDREREREIERERWRGEGWVIYLYRSSGV